MRDTYFDQASRAVVDVCPNELQSGYVISRVCTPLRSRRQGHASRLMTQVLADADTEGVVLWLDINPYGSMNYWQLRSWYRRLGFRKQRNGRYRRPPALRAD